MSERVFEVIEEKNQITVRTKFRTGTITAKFSKYKLNSENKPIKSEKLSSNKLEDMIKEAKRGINDYIRRNYG